MKTLFYNFSQNNSGGYFINDDKNGVCEEIIIEAENVENALKRLSEIGKKVQNFYSYCSCCGERWSDWLDESDGKKFPSIYDVPIEDVTKEMFRDRAFVHYIDGSFKEFKFKDK